MVSHRSRGIWAIAAVIVLALLAQQLQARQNPSYAPPRPDESVSPQLMAKARMLVYLANHGKPVAQQRAKLREYLAASGVSLAGIHSVLNHTRDGIGLWPGKDGANTRLGGQPVLPAGAEWPERDGLPFTFIGALDFAELPPMDDLPSAGTLALYWDFTWTEHRDAGQMDFVAATRAFYIPPGAPAGEPDPPRDSYPIDYKPLRGTAMPIAGDPNLVADELKGTRDLDRVTTAMNELTRQRLYPHHVLGAPIEVQGPVLEGMPTFFAPEQGYLSDESRERYTPEERTSAEDWMLLAQIEEDEGLAIADGGVLYFVILKQDLAAQRFDRVTAIQDSH